MTTTQTGSNPAAAYKECGTAAGLPPPAVPPSYPPIPAPPHGLPCGGGRGVGGVETNEATIPVPGPPFLLWELPIDLLALAVTYCVQTYHDDPRAVAVMLNDLRWYPPDRWPWLTDYFKTRLPKTETTTQQTPEVIS